MNCKRSCCWTPYACGKQQNCECHRTMSQSVELDLAELERAWSLTESRRNG